MGCPSCAGTRSPASTTSHSATQAMLHPSRLSDKVTERDEGADRVHRTRIRPGAQANGPCATAIDRRARTGDRSGRRPLVRTAQAGGTAMTVEIGQWDEDLAPEGGD